MRHILSKRILFRVFALPLAMSLALSLCAYDDIPASESAIRDAYFLGSRQGNLAAEFLARYSRSVPELKDGLCVSQVRIETPFVQVANYASQASNFSSQDAVKRFYGQQMMFRVYLDICYKPGASLNAIAVKVFQDKKQIIPLTSESGPYVPRVTQLTTLPADGEQIRLEFRANQIDASTFTFRIDTPDEQHAEVNFDMQALR